MRFIATARYGVMGYVGEFFARFAGLRHNDKVILRSDRGVEVGHIITQPRPMNGDTTEPAGMGEILRKVTPEDLAKINHIEEVLEPQEMAYCEKRIKELNLPMRLAEVEHLFGGTKIIFYFLADGRVDFRELVRDLAREYHTRIEMRQIGVRDEARLLAFYEHCGLELCCKTFMKNLEPVTMRMAKNQKATLDPAKISGRCGRLMCCLRFEDETYAALKQNLPRKGTRVVTLKGTGEVLSHDVLSQTVKIEVSPGREVVVSVDEIVKELPQESDSGVDDEEVKNDKAQPQRGAGAFDASSTESRREEPQGHSRRADGREGQPRGRAASELES